MKNLPKLQLVTVFSAGLIAWLFWDSAAALAVWLGGLTYIIPTLFAVLVLTAFRGKVAFPPALLFFVELNKLFFVFILMLGIWFFYPDINRLGYIVGLVLATQAGLLMFKKEFY